MGCRAPALFGKRLIAESAKTRCRYGALAAPNARGCARSGFGPDVGGVGGRAAQNEGSG